ncbi:hypothetical protein TNCV_763981 [Trichonephila clavipes]|nr:hypothetical protein TNCV_763981 [Trichonephila clavipes]
MQSRFKDNFFWPLDETFQAKPTELAVEVQSILHNLEDADINCYYVQGHSGNLGTSGPVGHKGNLLKYEPFDVCAVIPLETFNLGNNCLYLEV